MMKRKSLLITVGMIFIFALTANAEVIRWRLQTVDDPGLMEYKQIAEKFADRVKELSKGRMEIKVFPPGGIVSSFEVWDGLRNGLFEMSQHYLVYWSGKEPGLKAAQEWPVMRDPLQGLIWLYHGGGIEIQNNILNKHGIVYLGATPMEGEQIWSKKPIRGIEDLKGLKMRAAGVAAASFSNLGAAVVTVPGGEIYQALERGVIDAAEFTFPTVNYGYGFHEVTKYLCVLPTYSGGGFYDWIASSKAWEKLPDDLKEIVTVSINETTLLYWLRVRLETQRVFKKLKEHGMEFIEWSLEDLAILEKTRLEVMKEYAASSPEFAKKFESMMTILRELGYKE
jgi:TRAP-type mannitol/chloroaromatic compound transport system substrate-binding protein